MRKCPLVDHAYSVAMMSTNLNNFSQRGLKRRPYLFSEYISVATTEFSDSGVIKSGQILICSLSATAPTYFDSSGLELTSAIAGDRAAHFPRQ
jgi:hypothetical protein